MKKIILPLFLMILSVFILLPTNTVYAQTTETSTLYLPENSAMLGKDRWYDTGTFSVSVAIDKHLGSNPNAEKLLYNVLFYYPENRQVASAMTGSQLYTCTYANFGKWKNGRYQFGFTTMYSNGRIFKGVQSSSVIMQSK